MKNNTIKKLLPSLYIYLFSLALAGCITKNKPSTTSNTKTQPKTTNINGNSSESTTTGIDKDSETKEAPAGTDKASPNLPPQNTENLQNLVKEVKENCTIIQNILQSFNKKWSNNKKNKDEEQPVDQSYKNMCKDLPNNEERLILAVKEWVNAAIQKANACSSELAKAKQAFNTATTSANKITGNGAKEEAQDLITKAKASLQKLEKRYAAINHFVKDTTGITDIAGIQKIDKTTLNDIILKVKAEQIVQRKQQAKQIAQQEKHAKQQAQREKPKGNSNKKKK